MRLVSDILIVEDETLLSESIADYLNRSEITCHQASSYARAIKKIDKLTFDCIIIDIGLPDGSGIDLIKYVKRKKINSGLIIISARNSVEDKIEGLDTGADDYLTKPFHLSELNSRINSIVRRKKFDGKESLDFHEIKINPEAQLVFVNNKKIIFTKKEFDLLVYFISNANKILTKDAIAYSLWQNNSDLGISSEIIYTHIKNVRKKLIDNGCADYIQSIYGMGYKFGD